MCGFIYILFSPYVYSFKSMSQIKRLLIVFCGIVTRVLHNMKYIHIYSGGDKGLNDYFYIMLALICSVACIHHL